MIEARDHHFYRSIKIEDNINVSQLNTFRANDNILNISQLDIIRVNVNYFQYVYIAERVASQLAKFAMATIFS